MSAPGIITQAEAARRLGVCRDTVRAALRSGLLQGVRSKLRPERFAGVTVASVERAERRAAELAGTEGSR